MAETQRKPHGLMICLPYQGHINPFVGFALKLASKGFVITFVHLEFIHHKLTTTHATHGGGDDFFSEARRSGLDIRYATMPDPFPIEFNRDLHFVEYWETKVREFPALVDNFVANFIRSCDPLELPTFLVTDTIYASWSVATATKYKLLNVSFWTEPALVYSLLYHLDLLTLNAHFPCKENMEEEINYIPGVESVNTRDLMSFLMQAEAQGIIIRNLSKAFNQVKGADFVLHNTVHELESETINALNESQPNYAVGPINFTKNLPSNSVTKSFWSESDCTEWLESKPPGSVLYVSFGSLVQISKQEIEEIAHGLLLSQVDFIWVVRDGVVSASADANVLPVGYESKIQGKGLIVPWCNQIRVLESPAVGGFLTHCGWNSILESMWCGVPMICRPLMYDQPTNRKLLVEDWKIGIDLCEYGKVVDRKDVAAKIQDFMSVATQKRLREGADEVKSTVRHAMEADGSSETNFENFVVELKAKIYET